MMVKKILLYCPVFLLLSMGTMKVAGQQKRIDPKHLELSWQVNENNYNGKEEAKSTFTIKNEDAAELPARGWKIYFNFGHTIAPLKEDATIGVRHVNGGLYYFYPAEGFRGLKSKTELDLPVISRSWFVNQSEAPEGLYLVWDKVPEFAFSLAKVKVITPVSADKLKRYGKDSIPSLAAIYHKNEQVKVLTKEKITKILPTPALYKEQAGYFTVEVKTKLYYAPGFKTEGNLLAEELHIPVALEMKATSDKPVQAIVLRKENRLAKEAYELEVTAGGITLTASDPVGMFYGIQSLKVLTEPLKTGELHQKQQLPLQVKCVKVADQPAFGFRGIMLDVARNFQSKAEVKKLIDLLALYKLNVLHLHLNDDEGWRLEIVSLPELTGVGSKRGHSTDSLQALPPAYGSGPLINASAGSGYYSRADFIEILKYAYERHIIVIPEIETPGHARAAIKSMAARYRYYMKKGESFQAEEFLLQSEGDSSVYRSVQKWNDNVIDVSLPSVYRFITVVADDMISMYKEAGAPLATIHLGGDETPVGVWEKSPAFKVLNKENPAVATTADLWNYFFGKVSIMLKQRGLYLSGWEETALVKAVVNGRKGWAPNPEFKADNFHVNVWNNLLGNEDLAYRLANSGYKVILSCVSNFYFDMAYNQDFKEPGFNWGGLIDLEKTFHFIPFDYLSNETKDYIGRPLKKEMLSQRERLSAVGVKNIVGIQGLLWTETVRSPERLEYMFLPRLLGLAERAWAGTPGWAAEKDSLKAAAMYQSDWNHFINRTSREMKRLDHYGDGYHYRIPSAGILLKDRKVYANTELPGLVIRYTSDGTEPTNRSNRYLKPLTGKGTFSFRVFNAKGRGGFTEKLDAL